MNILVVNDDGIDAPGIKHLAEFFKKYGDVVVVAPNGPRSAYSHALSITNGIEVVKTDLFENGYSISGTPADCVRIAEYFFSGSIDLVVSGINNGYNLGTDIGYSGTVAAALEASLLDIPSIAFSAPWNYFQSALENIDTAYQFILKNALLSPDAVVNVNFPPIVKKGIKITHQGKVNYQCDYEKRDGLYFNVGAVVHQDNDPDTDIRAIHDGYISISFVQECSDDFARYNKNKKLNGPS